MKQLLLIMTVCLSLAVQSQKVNMDAYYSSNNTHIIGGDVYLTTNGGLVFGAGGSHASKTFFTSEKHGGIEFMDKCYNLAPMPSNLVLFDSFVEDRGTVTVSGGYAHGGFMVTGEWGLGFTQTIDLYTSANLSGPKPYPWQSNGWKSHGGVRFAVGGTLSQLISKRVGVMVGYNNIQLFKMGIALKLY